MAKRLERSKGEVSRNKDNGVSKTGKAGRPVGTTKLQPDDVTIKQIQGLGRIQCTQEEAAAVMGVSVPTFAKFLADHQKAKIAWLDGKFEGRASLRRNQFKMSEHNPTMAIWLGKQHLDQTDKSETTTTSINVDLNEILRSRRAPRVINHDAEA